MRVVFLTPVGSIGGAERVLLDMAESLRHADSGFDVHVIVGGDGPLLPALSKAGARTILLPMPATLACFGDSALIDPGLDQSPARMLWRGSWAAFDAWRYASRLRRLVRSLKPDIVHSNGNKFHLLSRLACGRTVPVVWHLHDFLVRAQP